MSVHTRTRHTNKKLSKKGDWRNLVKTKNDKYGRPAKALRSFRYRDDLTQQELADLLGIHYRQHISEMERGKRSISKEMAKKLGKTFNVSYKLFL